MTIIEQINHLCNDKTLKSYMNNISCSFDKNKIKIKYTENNKTYEFDNVIKLECHIFEKETNEKFKKLTERLGLFTNTESKVDNNKESFIITYNNYKQIIDDTLEKRLGNIDADKNHKKLIPIKNTPIIVEINKNTKNKHKLWISIDDCKMNLPKKFKKSYFNNSTKKITNPFKKMTSCISKEEIVRLIEKSL